MNKYSGKDIEEIINTRNIKKFLKKHKIKKGTFNSLRQYYRKKYPYSIKYYKGRKVNQLIHSRENFTQIDNEAKAESVMQPR